MLAIILAGGFGTRLRSVVSDVPKPMAPIAGRPFLSYQMDYWIEQGINHFVLAIGYKGEVIQNYFGNSYKNIPLSYSPEKTPLGTGGALIQAIQSVKREGPILLLNGDTYFEIKLADLLQIQKDKNADLVIGLAQVKNQTRYNTLKLDQENRIIEVQSNPNSENQFINGGVYLLQNRSLFNLKKNKCSFESDLLPTLLKKEFRVFGLTCLNTFIDIGIPEDYIIAQSLLTLKKDSSYG